MVNMLQANTFCTWLLLAISTSSQIQASAAGHARAENGPAVAMVCGKNSMHTDLSTGDWIPDASGTKDCLTNKSDILDYCKSLYPDLVISNVVEYNSKVKIGPWCKLGHHGSSCKGHLHYVTPYNCIVGKYNSPALDVEAMCKFQHRTDPRQCYDHDHWAAVVKNSCHLQNMVHTNDYSMLQPCGSAPDMWKGVEFVCCPEVEQDKSTKDSDAEENQVDPLLSLQVFAGPGPVIIEPTPAEAEPTPADAARDATCMLEVDGGMCKGYFPKWHFSSATQRCESFVYGGCGGNDNRFNNQEECDRKCARLTDARAPAPRVVQPSNTICTQRVEIGLCRAMIHRVYFNTKTGRCEDFYYGGCGGNDNNFRSMEECTSVCTSTDVANDEEVEIPTEPTPADAVMTSSTTKSYIGTQVDPATEHENYISSRLAELRDHQNRVAKVMHDWDEAKAGIVDKIIDDPSGSTKLSDKLKSDFDRTMQALDDEHQLNMEQIDSAHEARMDAAIVRGRNSALEDFHAQLSVSSPDMTGVMSSLRGYLQAEQVDQQHIVQHFNISVRGDFDQSDVDVLQDRLRNIQDRVASNVAKIWQLVPDMQTDDIQDDIDDMVMTLVPPVTLVVPDVNEELIDEPMISIDDGGLVAETETVEEELYVGDDVDEYYEEQGEQNGGYIDGEDSFQSNPTFDITSLDVDDDEQEPLPHERKPGQQQPSSEMLDIVKMLGEKMVEDKDEHGRENYPDVKIAAAAIGGGEETAINEALWLKWIGIAGACLGVLVIILTITRYYQARKLNSHTFEKVQVDDHLTAEERQLVHMQQNGFENPTYKFFEQHQVA